MQSIVLYVFPRCPVFLSLEKRPSDKLDEFEMSDLTVNGSIANVERSSYVEKTSAGKNRLEAPGFDCAAVSYHTSY